MKIILTTLASTIIILVISIRPYSYMLKSRFPLFPMHSGVHTLLENFCCIHSQYRHHKNKCKHSNNTSMLMLARRTARPIINQLNSLEDAIINS